MLTISASDELRASHPGAVLGFLEIYDVDNSRTFLQLDEAKRQVEARLREGYAGFARQDFLKLPVMAAYTSYYRRFDKTYHVLLQVESIVLKGKSLPNISPLVDANFMAEVETLALTAGHDVARLEGEVVIDVSRPGERMVQMTGTDKALLAGDMVMCDAGGICCSILYGQDNRSPITPQTSRALYVTYAPAGVGAAAVEMQLNKIEANVRLFAPTAKLVRWLVIEM